MSNQLLMRRRELEAMAKWVTANGLSPMTIQAKKLKSIGVYGRCEQENILVWNQLVSGAKLGSGTSLVQDTDGFFHITNNSISTNLYVYFTFLGDSGSSSDGRNTSTIGHKYYFKLDIKNVVETNVDKFQMYFASRYNNDLIFDGSTSYEYEIIKTCDYNRTIYIRIYPISGETASIDCDVRCMAIDLTLLYGEGNEPSTVQDFKDSYEEIFGHSLTYEPYNPGTVLETKDIVYNNGALRIGKNLANMNFTTVTAAGVQFSSSNQKLKAYGTITGGAWANFSLTNYAGAVSLSAVKTNSSGITKFKSGQTYSVSFSNYSQINDVTLVSTDKSTSKNISLTNGQASFTPDVDCCDLWVRLYGVDSTIHKDFETTVQIEKNVVPTAYEPFGIYTDGTQEILKVRHNGITPSSFAGYVATSEKTGPYSYSFSWSPTSSNTWNGVSAGNITIIEGHKYYYCANMLSSTPANLYLSFSSGLTVASKGKTNVVANTDYLISAISEATTSSNSIIMYVRAGYADAGGDYTGYANNIGLFDLTAIYGVGNEPTTTSEARQQLCLDSNFTTENLLSCGTYKDFQNLTTGAISRNVGVKVLTGTETFALDNWRSYSGTYAFALYKNELPGIREASTDNVKSTHFQSATYSGGGGLYYGGTGICIYSNNGNYSIFIRVPNSIATSMATMKSWLAQQYANGTPVIIVYPLNTTQSDSTSGQTLPTIRKGLNTLEVTQASVESTHDLSVQATYKEINDTHDYLSFTATAASSSITLNKVGSPTAVNLECSPNKTAWIPYTIGETIPIANGNTVYLRKTANTVATQLSSSSLNYYKFVMTGSIDGGGNIMSLLDKSCVSTTVGNYCFFYLFRDCTALKKSPKLPAVTLGTHCYYYMFYNAGLTTAPVLPATTMAANCYYGMFYSCKFTVAPQLPATELATSCYSYMFTNCTVMTVAPELPATVLKNNCYYQMFYQCFGLTSFPRLQFTTMATGCFTYMFQSCRNITSYHLSSLNTSGNTFYGNSGCNSLTIDAVVPPTIGSNTITGLKADCIIYVPAESVQAYKEKQYWSDRASYIQGLDENGNIPTS